MASMKDDVCCGEAKDSQISNNREPLGREDMARVLVTIKTYPTPSDRYGETVCTAGGRLDGERPCWIRLYPISFRLEEEDRKFHKYDIVELRVSKNRKDNRPESYRPHLESLKVIEKVDTKHNWRRRKKLLDGLIGAVTTCGLIQANKDKPFSAIPSLGLVKMLDPRVLSVEPGDPWDDGQLAKVRKLSQPNLLNLDGIKQLEPAPYRVRVSYRCESEGCAGHNPAILDWEAGQAGRKWRREYNCEKESMAKLRQKYEELISPDIDAHLFVGNMHQRRHVFSGLGIWSPRIDEEAMLYESDLLGV